MELSGLFSIKHGYGFQNKPSPSFVIPSEVTPHPTYVMEPRTLLWQMNHLASTFVVWSAFHFLYST